MTRMARAILAGALLLMASGLSGCHHKVQTLQVPQAQAPPLNPSTITVITPLPSVPPSARPTVEPASAPKPVTQPPPAKVKKQRSHKRHRENKDKRPATEIAGANKPEIETPPPATASTVSAAQWSTGTALDPKQRAQMLTTIQVQDHRAGEVKPSSSADQQAILVQIKLFLEKARDAVANNDLDGAMTLTTKARVLLDELQGIEP